MTLLFGLLLAVSVTATPAKTLFVQVAPAARSAAEVKRSPRQERAVVLIHGLHVHPFSHGSVLRAYLHDWQKPGSIIVKRLGQDSDVYSFAYAQDIAVEDVAALPELRDCLAKLRQLEYRSIVLVGHSAGGLLSRHFVEDHPDSGVTKVIQVCSPNGGSSWAEWRAVLPHQSAFLYSLTKEARQVHLRGRADKKVPEGIQFVCVVGSGAGSGDGLVLVRNQWTEELQKQGIPAYELRTSHWQAVRCRAGADKVAELVVESQPRWTARRVQTVKKALLGE